jgi:lysine-specific demethylase/histidyl-hydroxylase NO66
MSRLDFSDLIAPHAAVDFFDHYWQKASLLIKGDRPDRFESLLSATGIQGILSMADQLPAEAVEIVGKTSGIETAEKSPDSVSQFFMSGSTIRVKGVEKYSDPLRELCRTVELELGFPVRTNLYCTPSDSRGFSLHFDTHEVLVLQLLGKKRWQVFEPITKLPLEYVPPLPFEDDLDEVKRSRGGRQTGQDDIDAAELRPLTLEGSLEAGDCLYLPRGFVHQAEALEEPSVHISLGIHVITWLDLLSVMLGQAAYLDERLRQSLPLGSLADPETLKQFEKDFSECVEAFTRSANPEKAFNEIRQSLIRRRNVESVDADLELVNRDTKLESTGRLQVYLSADGTMAGLTLGQEVFWMPMSFAAAFRFITERESFVAHELAGQFTETSKLNFVRRLVEDGFLRIVD